MEEREIFYQNKTDEYTRQVSDFKKKIHVIGSIRLGLAIGAGLSLWLFWEKSGILLAGIVAPFLLLFVVFMIYHNKLFAAKAYTEALVKLNNNEQKALNYDFSAFDGAPEKSKAEHSFSLDLDLFGPQSFFQSINRTITVLGRERLSQWLLQPLSDKKEILKRQEAIREMAAHTPLRQHFYATGITGESHPSDLHLLEQLFQEENYFSGKVVWNVLIWLVPAIWLLLILSTVTGLASSSVLSIYFLICLIVAYCKTKKINTLYNTVDKIEHLILKYANLIKCIEKSKPFHSSALQEIRDCLVSPSESSSAAINRLSSYIKGLNQRLSLAGVICNILYLRDIRHAILLEKWKGKYADKTKVWINALAEFEAYSSLGNFAFNHPDYIYPQITDTYFKMEGEDLGHPLLNRKVCVKNPIDIKKSPSFLIVTGANMAGKSTYLRTVGINYLLSCIGAPVCAKRLTVSPASLVTSLRTSDSLSGNESYFFAELKRLKMIIDRLQKGEKLFIILDEILKGTNSIDKQKGSLALVKQLIDNQSCGIIATHDLVLGTLASDFPQQIRNYCFEADIINNELSFSYQMKEGIAQNMNACFLMKKMGITV